MPENARDVFAENLLRLMNRSRCTQAELVRDLRLRQSTVSDWMGGKKYPRVDKVQLLADYFGVSRAELTERHKAPPPAAGSPEWLEWGLEARGIIGHGELTRHQLQTILHNMDMLARAFLAEE